MAAQPLHYAARTDANVTQLPKPLPTWNGANGLCATYKNPAYPGSTIVRVTAASLNPGSLETAASGDPQLGTSDGKHFIVRTTGSTSHVIAFDPTTLTCGYTGVSSSYDALEFSDKNQLLMWALSKTQIHQITAKPDWSGIASDRLLTDLADVKCLGVGFKPIWKAEFTVADDDATFKTAFSNTGGQGSGNYAVVWSQSLGCTVWNTLTGAVTVNGVAIGTVSIPARFYLHEAGAGRTALALVAPTLKTSSGKPGCVVGKCLVDEPYVWVPYTTNVMPCNLNCDGHSAKGASGFYTGKQQRFHSYVNPGAPLTPMVSLPTGSPDEHGSAHNQVTTQPLFLVTAKVPSPAIYPAADYDEVLAIPTDGSRQVERLGQTMNTGKSKYFICANAIGVVDQTGTAIYFTSDMGANGSLGYEADGKTPRCDVFALVPTPK